MKQQELQTYCKLQQNIWNLWNIVQILINFSWLIIHIVNDNEHQNGRLTKSTFSVLSIYSSWWVALPQQNIFVYFFNDFNFLTTYNITYIMNLFSLVWTGVVLMYWCGRGQSFRTGTVTTVIFIETFSSEKNNTFLKIENNLHSRAVRKCELTMTLTLQF